MILPTDLLDSVLVAAGVVLVVTGLVMFIRSKTSTQASSVEAFGIMLNVTHPSLILVLAGVGLMLAPRLLPEPPGKADKPESAVTAEAAKPPPAEPAIAASPAPAAPRPSIPAVAAPSPQAKPAMAAPAAPPPFAATAQPTQRAKPSIAAPSAPKEPAVRIASTPRAVTPPAAVPPSTATAPTGAAQPEAAPTPPAAAKPARPILAYAALGLPISRSFWGNETRASYTQRMHAALQQAGRGILRMEPRNLELEQKEFDAWWNESGQHPRSRELCAASHAPRALLATRVETPTTISSVDSAYWPELKLRLFICDGQRLYRQQKTLAPQNDDAWPFSVELNSEIERFLRAYRSDLTD